MALRELEDGIRQLELRLAALQATISAPSAQLGDPIGQVVAFAGSTAPTGWLLCDGATISRTEYAQLFSLVGITYGAGNGSTTFALPDARGRVLAGRDASQAEFNTLGETGGAKTHTLTTAQMPSHAHSIRAGIGASTGSLLTTSGDGFLGASGLGRYADPSFKRTFSVINPEGGDQPHNNLQPYLVTQYIIRAA
jgi:microcystin-dependent protein